MDRKAKLLAYEAIDENIKDSTARQIVRYVFECEVFGQDTIKPSNAYLAEKYNWDKKAIKEKTRLNTTITAIKLAKKSQFITTTGRGRKRCLELNVGFLKGKMAEVAQNRNLKIDISKSFGDSLSVTRLTN